MEVCGKFRGVVVSNVDPLQIGRIQVNVPEVQGGITAFALPCLPFAGDGVGFFARPPVGANVWVEFERGDVNFPIWTGCFWAAGEAPPAAANPARRFLQVPGVSLTLDDTPGVGGLILEVPAQNATIRIAGGVVTINDGALTVT
jgi:hypothetical protein